MWKQCCAVLATLLLSAYALAQAAAPIQLDAQRDEFALTGHLEWLEDASARMTLAEVRAAPGWAVLPSIPNAGFTRSALWILLTVVQPPDSETDWRLSIDDTLLNEAQLHVALSDGRMEIQHAGHSVLRTEWPLDSRIPTFRLRLSPGKHDLYLRLQSQHTLSHPIRLHSINGYIRQNGIEALSFGAYFGVFAVVILLQFAFWLAGR